VDELSKRSVGIAPVLDPKHDHLAPVTDLAICKATLSRPKDWVDITAMTDARSLDTAECVAWVARLIGEQHERVFRLRGIFADQPRRSGSTRPTASLDRITSERAATETSNSSVRL